jgi:hypothetical protein
MTEPFELPFKLTTGSYIPFFSASLDNDEVDMDIFDEQVGFWTQIPMIIASPHIEASELGVLRAELDWSKVIAYLQRSDTRRYAECFPDPPDEYYLPDFFEEDDEDKTAILGRLIIPNGIDNKSSFRDHLLIRHYIQKFFCKLFIALNLSSPGCFNLDGGYISVGDSDRTDMLKLSDKVLAEAYHCTSKFGSWPAISSLPLGETWKWLSSLKIDTKSIARSAVEKVVFALLHACEQHYTPHQVMWLSIALEALFDTSPDTSIGKTLRNRIFLVLDEPRTHKKNVRQLINNFYKLRSSLVHGNLEVPHPVDSYFCSDDTRRYYNQFREPIAFATSVILATLQKCITNNWLTLEFTEGYKGISN